LAAGASRGNVAADSAPYFSACHRGSEGRLRYARTRGYWLSAGEFVRSFAPVLARLETPTCPCHRRRRQGLGPAPLGPAQHHRRGPHLGLDPGRPGRQASFPARESLAVCRRPKKRRSKSSQRKPDVEPAPELRADSSRQVRSSAKHGGRAFDDTPRPRRSFPIGNHEAAARRVLRGRRRADAPPRRGPSRSRCSACPPRRRRRLFFFRSIGPAPYPSDFARCMSPRRPAKARYRSVWSPRKVSSLWCRQGAIELHCWSSTTRKPGNRTLLIFDLRPWPGSTWGDLRDKIKRLAPAEAAVSRARALLEDLGGKGLHSTRTHRGASFRE
jgi:hypothetical protein